MNDLRKAIKKATQTGTYVFCHFEGDIYELEQKLTEISGDKVEVTDNRNGSYDCLGISKKDKKNKWRLAVYR